MRKMRQTTAILLFIMLTATMAWAVFAISTKVRVRVNTTVNQWTQSVTDLTTVQTIFSDHSIAACDRVLISVDNTSANYLTDLDIRLTDDNNNMTDSWDVIGGTTATVFMVNGYSSCTATQAATSKCYVLLPSNHGFTNVDLTATATTVATVTTKLTCWQ